MKIAKYIVLLLLLLAGTLAVFIATKDGSYTIAKSKIIDVPKEIVLKYVTEKQNWDSINPWSKQTASIVKDQFVDEVTMLRTLSILKKNQELKMSFTDTLNKKTCLTWETSGKMNFEEKVLGIIGKGSKNDFEEKFEQGLTTISKILTREINSFTVKIDGFIKRDTIFYIQKPIVSRTEDIPTKIKLILPQLQKVLTSTNTPSTGSPFIVYHSKDSIKNKVTYSVAIPIKQKIYTSAGSDIITGQINPSSTVKATLTGNYNHKNEAHIQLRQYLANNRLMPSEKFKEIEILVNSALTEKSASKWITEIYIPVKPIVAKKIVVKKRINNDSITKAIIKDILGKDKK